jgi:hypothetical protein
MFQLHSIAGRILIGKSVGFLVGLLSFFFLPNLGMEHELLFRLGLWVFYALFGVTIGLAGVLTVHPFGFRLYFWMRGAVLGTVFHLMLVLLAYDAMMSIMLHPAFAWLPLTSPFWIVLDGAILGMIMAALATKIVGEGALPVR